VLPYAVPVCIAYVHAESYTISILR
jgi:hypothetical protein